MTLLCWSWIFSVLRPKMCTTMHCGRCSFALLERAGPPCRTMSVLRHRPGGPRPVRSPAEPFGLSTLTLVSASYSGPRHGVVCSAGRRVHRPQPRFSSMVVFLFEQPQPVERYTAPGNSLLGEVPSWWSNPMWLSYAAESGLFEVDFNQGQAHNHRQTPKDPGVATQSCWLSGCQVLFRP